MVLHVTVDVLVQKMPVIIKEGITEHCNVNSTCNADKISVSLTE